MLAEIDPLIYGTQVSAQQANLAAQPRAARAGEGLRREHQGAARHRARRARAHAEALRSRTSRARSDLDTAQGNYDSRERPVRRRRWRPSRARRRPSTRRRRSSGQSTANLGYTKIYSPVDGVVVTRGIDPGATVVSSFQARCSSSSPRTCARCASWPTSTRPTWARSPRAWTTDCVVDAFPGEIFHGKVSQIRYSPNNVSGVVTYPAVVEVDNPDEKLRPGMTSTITVHTHEAHGVPRIPNAALRYQPDAPDGAGRQADPAAARARRSPRARGASGCSRATSPAPRRTRCASSRSASPTASSRR